MNDYDQKENSEILWFAGVVLDDIKTAKRQTWAITYYVLLTYAAVVGFIGLGNNSNAVLGNFWFRLLALCFPSYFINILGNYHLLDTCRWLSIYRIRLTMLKNKMDPFTIKVFDIDSRHFPKIAGGKGLGYLKFYRYFWNLHFWFIVLLNIGSVCVTFFVLGGKICDDTLWVLVLVFHFLVSPFLVMIWYVSFNGLVDMTIDEYAGDLIKTDM